LRWLPTHTKKQRQYDRHVFLLQKYVAGLQASLESAIRIAELTKDYTTVTKLQEQILAKHNEVGALIDASMERCNQSSIVADFIASIFRIPVVLR